MSSEFSIIDQFFKPLSAGMKQQGEIGIGDDGAVISCPSESQLVVVTDTLIEGVHFPEQTDAYDIAWKALAVNLSDLAAMGATPAFYTLALTLPEKYHDDPWLMAFADGLKAIGERFSIPLVGGDTTKGPVLTLTVTAQGWVPVGEAILRAGAGVGDDIYVSGLIGDGGLGLKAVEQMLEETGQDYRQCIEKLNRPMPRIELGKALLSLASAAIDISDGLLADLKHILEASAVSADVDFSQVPFSSAMMRYQRRSRDYLMPLVAGDDYELCFTASKARRAEIEALAETIGVRLSRIGEIKELEGQASRVCLMNLPENLADLEGRQGYQHF